MLRLKYFSLVNLIFSKYIIFGHNLIMNNSLNLRETNSVNKKGLKMYFQTYRTKLKLDANIMD